MMPFPFRRKRPPVLRDSNVRARVVIVGGGFGGLRAAKALAEAPVQITLVDRRNHHLFQPLLYQVATAALSPADIAQPIRSVLRGQPNVEVILAEVDAVDVAEKEVVLDGDAGRLPYDYLILAAGANHAYFGHDEWAPNAPGLKTLEDALDIRRRILTSFEEAEREPDPARRKALMTFVVVGGGPTGVEMAGAIAEIARFSLARDFRHIDTRDAKVILIEASTKLLAAFPDRLSRRSLQDLERLGVEVRFGKPVTAITPDAVTVGDEKIPANTIVWAAGVQASPLARSLGVELDRAGRVHINPDLSVPGHPEIFVIGDMASLEDARGRPLPGVAQVAMQQGVWAAANILRAIGGKPARPFRYRDLGNMATIGRNSAVADIRGLRLTGFVAWLAWAVVHILNLIGFRNRVLVGLQWLWSYLTLQRGARLITGEAQ
ncbi:MAG TPA: NAD(P)/FAD-dependent oxidoreductase [Thermomicrobiales bacterium]|nr:NAD(P)/FAD-dependent oxidoreductase [Thermomicrobiales bacterium]